MTKGMTQMGILKAVNIIVNERRVDMLVTQMDKQETICTLHIIVHNVVMIKGLKLQQIMNG